MGTKREKEEHVIALGIEKDPPERLRYVSVEEIFDYFHDINALVYIPHPFLKIGKRSKLTILLLWMVFLLELKKQPKN